MVEYAFDPYQRWREHTKIEGYDTFCMEGWTLASPNLLQIGPSIRSIVAGRLGSQRLCRTWIAEGIQLIRESGISTGDAENNAPPMTEIIPEFGWLVWDGVRMDTMTNTGFDETIATMVIEQLEEL